MDDEIRMCLSCPAPRCTNCLGNNHHKKQFQVILQIDRITEKVVASFSTIVDASQATGINKSCISEAIHGRSKTAGNYIWKRTTRRR